MATKILGVQHFDFEDKDGRKVIGDKLHCVEPADRVEFGESVYAQSVKPEILEAAMREAGITDKAALVGLGVDYAYDRYGKVAGMQFYDLDE